jgi:hypothetical protein
MYYNSNNSYVYILCSVSIVAIKQNDYKKGIYRKVEQLHRRMRLPDNDA